MKVTILNYRVRPAQNAVDVDLEIDLPTGRVNSTIVAFEASLNGLASQAGRNVWDERDLVAVVSGVFSQLSSNVAVAS